MKGIGWFDFVVKTKNGIGVIEYQGHQHYMPVSFGGKKPDAGWRNFIKAASRDERKRKWCSKKGYSLLEVPYWDKKTIPEIVGNFLAGSPVIFSEPPEAVQRYTPHRKAILKNYNKKQSCT